MAKLVVVLGAIPAKTIAGAELCGRLRDVGHQVTVVLAADALPEGIDPEWLPIKLQPTLNIANKDLPAGRKARVELCRKAAQAVDITPFESLLCDVCPDLVLIDVEAHEHVIAAAATGQRVALLDVFFNLWQHPGIPPVHVNTTPGVGIRGTHAGIALSWWTYRLWRWRQRRASRRHGADALCLLEAFARRVGYQLVEEVDYYQGLLPFLYRNLPVVNTNLLDVEFPHTPDSRVHYVGPMTNRTRRPQDMTPQAKEATVAIRRIAQAARSKGSDHKIVYCSFGSYFYGDDRDFWERVLRAAAQHEAYTFIMGLGGRLKAQDLEPLPANVHAFEWAPQTHALAVADLAMTHGGMTSMYECIDAGVPMVLYPYEEIFDQFGTANRAQYHGLGQVGDRRKDTPATIYKRIADVLSDTGFRERVNRFQAIVRQYVKEDRLSQALEILLQPSRSAGSGRGQNA